MLRIGLGLAALLLALVGARLALSGAPGRALAMALLDGRQLGASGVLRLDGLDGDILGRASLRELRLTDDSGDWLVVQDVTLDWKPFALLTRTLHVEAIEAGEIALLRRPPTDDTPEPKSRLPDIRLQLDRLEISRLDIAPAVAGIGGAFRLNAEADARAGHASRGRIDLVSLQPAVAGAEPDRMSGAIAWSAEAELDATIKVRAAPDQALAALLQLPAGRALAADARLQGRLTELSGQASAKLGENAFLDLRAWRDGTDTRVEGRLLASDWPLLDQITARTGVPLAFAARIAPDTSGAPSSVEVSAAAPALEAALSAPLTEGAAAFAGPARMTVARAQLDQLTGQSLGGLASGRLEVSKEGAGWTLRGPVRLADLHAPGVIASSLEVDVHLSLSPGKISLEAAGPLAGLRAVDLPSAGAIDGRLATRLDWLPDTGLLSLAQLELDGGDARLTAHGDVSPASGRLDLSGTASLGAGRLLAQGRGALAGDWAIVRTRTGAPILADIDISGRGVATGDADLDRVMGRAPRLRASLEIADDALLVRNARLDAAGLRAGVNGRRAADGRLSGAFTANLSAPLAGPQFRIATARLTGDFAGRPSAVRLRARLSQASGQASGVAIADAGGDLDISLGRSLDGSLHLAANAAGKPATLDTRLTGTLAAPGVSALTAKWGGLTLTSDRMVIGAEGPVGAARLSGSLDGIAGITEGGIDARLTAQAADGLTLDARTSDLSHPGLSLADARLRLAREGDAWTAAASAKGRAQAPFDLGGSLKAQRDGKAFTGTARISGAIAGSPVTSSRAIRWSWNPESWSADAGLKLLGGEVEISAAQSARAANATLRLSGLDLRAMPFLSASQAAEGTVSGDIAFSHAAGEKASGRLDVSIRGLRAVGEADAPADLDLTGQLGDGRLRMTASGDGPGLKLAAQAELAMLDGAGFAILPDMSAPLSAEVTMDGAAERLWSLAGPSSQSLAGRASLQLAVGGTLSRPRLDGALDMTDGRYSHEASGVDLSNLTFAAAFNQNAVQIRSLSAQDRSGGRLSGAGSAHWNGDFRGELALKVERLRALSSANRSATLSGDVKLAAVNRDILLSGELVVDQARVSIDQPAAASIPRLPNVRRKGFAQRAEDGAGRTAPLVIRLDLSVNAPRRLFISGRGLDTEWGGAVRITGTPLEPILTGDAKLVRGALDLVGRRFSFDSGAIRFTGPSRDARADLEASRQAGDMTAKVNVSGTIDKLDIVLSSTPAYPQDEILARVLFNRSASQISTLEAAQATAALAALAGGDAFDLAGGVRRAVGLDRLAVGAEGGVASLAAGKYIADNVYLELGAGGEGGAAASVEWEPRDNLSVTSQAKANGDTRIAVRWKKDY